METVAEDLDVEVRNEAGARKLGQFCNAVWIDEVREFRRPGSDGVCPWRLRDVSHFLIGAFDPQPGWDISSTTVKFFFQHEGKRYSGTALLQYRLHESRLRIQGTIIGDEKRMAKYDLDEAIPVRKS